MESAGGEWELEGIIKRLVMGISVRLVSCILNTNFKISFELGGSYFVLIMETCDFDVRGCHGYYTLDSIQFLHTVWVKSSSSLSLLHGKMRRGSSLLFQHVTSHEFILPISRPRNNL